MEFEKCAIMSGFRRSGYICVDIVPDQKPLLWWKQYSSQLPVLSKLAHKYLCIPATSVSSERALSVAGHVINST